MDPETDTILQELDIRITAIEEAIAILAEEIGSKLKRSDPVKDMVLRLQHRSVRRRQKERETGSTPLR